MTSQEIDRFFRVLATQLDQPVKIILTGAAAGNLWGHLRPSMDIDFAVELSGRQGRWHDVEEAVTRTTKLTGIPAQYTQDLDRWGQISLLDYRQHTTRYKQFGVVAVHTLNPAYWAIGKLTRYLDPDIQDLVDVLPRKKIPAVRLVAVWGEAVKKSPASTACLEFKQHVEHFLKEYGRKIWGRAFEVQSAVQAFYKSAGIGPQKP